MINQYQLIREVSPGTTGWTVKVVVAEKFSLRTTEKSPTKYQNLILMDSEATLYEQNITAFQDELILERTYLISNVYVKVTSAEYKEKSGEVQWTISGRTRGKSRRRSPPHLCQRPLDQACCKSSDVHEWQRPEGESQHANPQDRPPQYFSENLPHTGIEPTLSEDFLPHHLRPYQFVYAPGGLELHCLIEQLGNEDNWNLSSNSTTQQIH
ncbi:replication protein A 70 kDa DNA-binding subunit B-like [Forsythia ovata]|uniref:Replication protein A 70 kDa DNA-binding subunit B-like n=1 Tax=Forsythia ovata TaxID=205694 RepID=A0ABD1U650_9LAMI